MIRTLTDDDARDMTRIHKASFPVGWPEDDMKLHIGKDLALGIGNPLQAFILIQIGADQADILTIATAPVARRKGKARLLLEAAENALKAQKIRTLYLDVSEMNLGAIALYKQMSFTPIGRRPAYYRTTKGRVAALTFSKGLS